MDNFTATVVSVGDQTPASVPMQEKKSGVPKGAIIALLVIAVLMSAGATLYLLFGAPTSSTPPVAPQTTLASPTTQQAENPFSDSAVEVNPFDEIAADNAAVNPFAETQTNNPFDQFESETATASNQAQNPF